MIFIFCVLFPLVGFAQTLQPYKNVEQMVIDLNKSVKIATQIHAISKGDKKHYELLGKAFAMQGIICRRAEITNLSIVQQVFERMQKQHVNAQLDYIIFTEGCRNMYGLYR